MRGFFLFLAGLVVLGFAFYLWQPAMPLRGDVLTGSGSSVSSINGSPKVTSSDPKDGADNVPLNQQMTIMFSQEMDTAATAAAVHANFPYYAHWDSAATLRLEPAQLRPDEEYQFFVSTDAKDTQGRPLREALHVSFKTGNQEGPAAAVQSSSEGEITKLTASAVRPWTKPMVVATSKPPIVEAIVVQEWGTIEGIPRYKVSVLASDPEGASLSYNWNLSCGRIRGSARGDSIEWRTDPEGCRSAVLSVEVSDVVGAKTTYVQRAF